MLSRVLHESPPKIVGAGLAPAQNVLMVGAIHELPQKSVGTIHESPKAIWHSIGLYIKLKLAFCKKYIIKRLILFKLNLKEVSMKRYLLSGLGSLLALSIGSSALAIEHKIGADLRFRYENWDNLITLGTNTATNPFKDRSFFRLRVMLWDDIKFSNNTTFRIRLNTEPKYQMGPYYHILKDNVERRKFDQDEVVIDNLYLDIKRVANLPLNLRIGRQDFLGPDGYGEGFLIMDGTPGDGSRTFYFNAIKAQLLLHPKHTVDFVFAHQKERDVYLPSLHPSYDDGRTNYIEHKKRLSATDETAFWIYGRSKINPQLTLEPYYIYKKEEGSLIRPARPIRIPGLYLHNIGVRGVYTLPNNFKIRAELVHQFGEYSNNTDRRAWGGYAFLEMPFPHCPTKPVFELGYVYLSGDDPKSKKDEAFNPLFSRNPNWNELIIYTYLLETTKWGGPIPGYWTNLKMPILRVKFSPLANLNVNLSYQKLYADEKTRLRDRMFSNKGKERGDLFLAILNYKFTKTLSGMLQYEIFDPDDFYSKSAKTAHFFRAQLHYRY